MNLNIRRIRYHRNGVMGTGFYLVEFSVADEGECYDLRAIQFDTDDWHRLTAVIDPSNVAERFRGDEFAHDIREACERASEDGTAHEDPPDLTDLMTWLASQ
jgi:hypothetical protein